MANFEEEMRGHIEVLNREMGDIKIDMSKIKTDLDWLKKFFWIVAGSSIGALIAILIK